MYKICTQIFFIIVFFLFQTYNSQKPENLVARFGQWNIENNTQPLPVQEANIFAIVVHPSYYSGGLFHDVAILILEKPVTYGINVSPICLPEQGMVFPTGIRCYGIGWGRNSFGKHQIYYELNPYHFSLWWKSTFIYIFIYCFKTRRKVSSGTSKDRSSYCRQNGLSDTFAKHKIRSIFSIAWVIYLCGRWNEQRYVWWWRRRTFGLPSYYRTIFPGEIDYQYLNSE